MSDVTGRAIGITGGIACGKSEVARIFEANEVPVLDTDHLAHDLMRSNTPVFDQVVKYFGGGILGEDGEIDRKELGAVVFADEAELAVLNQLVHPAVGTAWRCWLNEQLEQGRNAAVMIPLLFEVDATDGWDAIITVAAEPAQVMARLIARGLTEQEAEERLAAQWPLSEKIKRADYVIENNGSLDELKMRTEKILKQILAPEGERQTS